jgi:hypothetical protein
MERNSHTVAGIVSPYRSAMIESMYPLNTNVIAGSESHPSGRPG